MQNIALLVRAAQVSLVIFSLFAASFGQTAAKKAASVKKAAPVKAGIAAPSGAFNWFVTKTDDTNDGVCDSDCSLREALAVSASGDWIFFTSLFDTPQTITLASGLVVASKNLVITGPGADRLTLAGTSPTDSVLRFTGSNMTLSGVTITGGSSTITGVGGGIAAYNTLLSLDGVHVTGNSATNGGGGIYLEDSMGFSMQNSTISGNTSNRGAGLMMFLFSEGTVTNSTISGNIAISTYGGGAALENSSTLTVRNSTVYNNTAATAAGGIFGDGSSLLILGSSIIAANEALSQPEIYSTGTVLSTGFNLIGNSAGDAADTVLPIGYQPNDILDTDPQLNALSGGLGTTPTHMPKASPVSPVIDKGNSFGEPWDQRGQNRIYDNPSIANAPGGDGADIGSSERGASTAASIAVGGRITAADGRGVKGAMVSIQLLNTGETRTLLTGSFGYYRFDNLQAGQAYIVSVAAKRYTFTPSSRLLSPGDSAMDENFVAVQ